MEVLVKILAIEREVAGVTAEHCRPHYRAEAARVWELQQKDVIREVYLRQDRPEAVLVLECDDIGEAQAALDTLPLVTEGLIAFEVIPLGPFPGYQRLFAAE